MIETANFLSQLNEAQKSACEKVNGRVLILAGAGSGKTRVLTFRMAHLIKNLQVSPENILGLTFTNKAAGEMRERMAALIGKKLAKGVTLSTFHSFCMQILRKEIHHLGYTHSFSLYDEKDIERVAKGIAKDILQQEKDIPSLMPTLNAISMALNKGLAPSEIQDTGSDWHDQFTRDVYVRLSSALKAYNAVDFDHLLSLTVTLFEKFPEVLARYQERYRFIMIDEYQDTNPVQSKLAELLSQKHGNLCVVGDDDQSIYGWRGAEVDHILKFAYDHMITLEQNYRSSNHILNAANSVISQNSNRHPKKLWSALGKGIKIEIFHSPNEQEEASAVVDRLIRLKEEQNLQWKDIAILYRSNTLSRIIEASLRKAYWKDGDSWSLGVPYEIHGGLSFYARSEIKDLVAYLRAINNPADQEAMLRIVNVPRRGIGDGALGVITEFQRRHKKSFWEVLLDIEAGSNIEISLTPKCKKGISEFVSIIQYGKRAFESLSYFDAMKSLLEKIEYQKAITEQTKNVQLQAVKWDNVQEFVSAIADFEKNEESPQLQEFISQVILDQNFEKKQQDTFADRVRLMTMHSAKGLEFPACYLVGLEDHLLPHERSIKQGTIDEERRLFYVAITRAKRFLCLSMAMRRNKMGKPYMCRPSRFLPVISKSDLEIMS